MKLRARGARAAAWLRQHADGRGLPAADARVIRTARVITLLATLWFAGVGIWEIAAPFGAGHYASSAAVALGGENMLRFGTILPITHHPLGAPSTTDAYVHHPFGIFWTSAFFVAVFGHAEWVCRLPAVLLSVLTVPLLSALGRALWSPLAGALAAVAFVLTPIALAFANFNSLEVPVIFGTLLASHAYVRFRQTSRRRFMLLTWGALAYAVNSDWAAFVFAAALFALILARLLLPLRKIGRIDRRRTTALLGWGVLVVAAVGAAYVIGLAAIDRLDDLVRQGEGRARGLDEPLAEVLAARRYWILLMFTPPALYAGAIAAPVAFARAVLRNSELEALPLALLGMAVFQYVVFKQGADVHVFWPHYFAPYFALGLALLAQSGFELARRASSPLRASRPRVALALAALPLVLGLAVPAAMARDAVQTLVYARKTGGRFNERGQFIQPDKDKAAALEFAAPKLAANGSVALHPGMRQSLWVPWVLGRPVVTAAPGEKAENHRYYVVDARFSTALELSSLLRSGRATALGPFWLIDRALEPASLVAYSIERRPPSLFERVFVSSTHALREVVPDPFATWELRDFAGYLPNPPPAEAPKTLEQLRVAHNIAIAAADTDRARKLRAELLALLDRSRATEYADGTLLLGTRLERGASDVLSVVLEASRAGDERFMLSTEVEAPLPASLVPADELRWDVGLPPNLPRTGWRAGYLYSSVTEISKRPGRERFIAWWASSGHPLLTKSGAVEVTLLVLP